MVKLLLHWLGLSWIITAFLILPVISYFNGMPVANLTLSLFMLIWMIIVLILGAVRLAQITFELAGGNDKFDASD